MVKKNNHNQAISVIELLNFQINKVLSILTYALSK